jgi:hypothetical protein
MNQLDTGVIGVPVSVHPRTLTYRVIAIMLAVFLFPLCYVAFVGVGPGVGIALAASLLGLLGWFFVLQAKEQLEVYERGIRFTRGRVIWTLAWDDAAGALFVFHDNDLAKVKVRTRAGERIAFDLNWKGRPQLEGVVLENLQNCERY